MYIVGGYVWVKLDQILLWTCVFGVVLQSVVVPFFSARKKEKGGNMGWGVHRSFSVRVWKHGSASFMTCKVIDTELLCHTVAAG
jgi:hypothetical protein